MAEFSELPLSLRLFLRTYPWRRNDPAPWAPMRHPLATAKIAVLTTAGLVVQGQAPFDDDVRGGDWSYREIPDSVDVKSLVETHRSSSFDHSGIRADPGLAFPVERLRELGIATNHRHFSLMGSITAPGRMTNHTAPEVADKLLADRVDAVLLVPI